MTYVDQDGSWDQAAIMRRGHQIASEMDEERPYSKRLSTGLTRAWAEAKQEAEDKAEAEDIAATERTVVHTEADDWQSAAPEDSEDETRRQVEGDHAAVYDGVGEELCYNFLGEDLPPDAPSRTHEKCQPPSPPGVPTVGGAPVAPSPASSMPSIA